MPIDIDREKLLTITEASHRIPKRTSVRTVWRWASHGVDGVKLETVKIGGNRFTSSEAIDRFIDRGTNRSLSNLDSADDIPADGARRSREIARAEKELEQAGYKSH